MTELILLFLTLFFFITLFSFDTALFLFLLLLPAYVIRFSIGPLPTTLVEAMFGILLAVWFVKQKTEITRHTCPSVAERRWVARITKQYPFFFFSTLFFLLGATISIFTSVDTRAALGVWKAFYIEPFLFFVILVTCVKEKKQLHFLFLGLVLSGLATSILAIYQHYTGWMVPYDFWEKGASYRVTGWYGFPNGVGLFLAPIVPLALFLLKETRDKISTFANATADKQDTKNYKSKIARYLFLVSCFLFLPTAFLAILFAKSTGAIVGLLAGFGLLLLFWKKTRLIAMGLGIVGIAALLFAPQLAGVRTEVFLRDWSGEVRKAIWRDTAAFLYDHPFAGAGLASYEERIAPYHSTVLGKGVEIFHHPHNIFLTIWVNTGLMGIIGFVGMTLSLILLGFREHKNIGVRFAFATLTVILVHGLVDSPYIKNDLSMLFWFVVALFFIQTNPYTGKTLFEAFKDAQFKGGDPDLSKKVDEIVYGI